jgi:hypothetical protein
LDCTPRGEQGNAEMLAPRLVAGADGLFWMMGVGHRPPFRRALPLARDPGNCRSRASALVASLARERKLACAV